MQGPKIFNDMSKTKGEIIQSIVSQFRPELYVKRVKVGLTPHEDGKTILVVEYSIEKEKMGEESLDKSKVLGWTRDLAQKIRNTGKIPIGYTQTQVKII
jgi:hypothetical protein